MAERLDEIFKQLKEEAGPHGAFILMRAKGGPGENVRILTAGQVHSVMGLLAIGGPWVNELLNKEIEKLLSVDKKP